MNALNLTERQRRLVRVTVTRAVESARVTLNNAGIDAAPSDMARAFLEHFAGDPEVRREGVLRAVLQTCFP